MIRFKIYTSPILCPTSDVSFALRSSLRQLETNEPRARLSQPAHSGRERERRKGLLGCGEWIHYGGFVLTLLSLWLWVLGSGTMCTTIMILSTLALVLRRHLNSRHKTSPEDSGKNEVHGVQISKDTEK
ncbi:Photoreceptor disk component PRCD [Dissostichus eleginoides]|uniref:Photoreceptor disk component PRCD n=1 Tax=Dissostichus eleginoides TaxID=100907 RepID=A0AAD9BPE5_DISEL|nr:Photoreceptor disk component PRCD [Dissostichus eleginoides]